MSQEDHRPSQPILGDAGRKASAFLRDVGERTKSGLDNRQQIGSPGQGNVPRKFVPVRALPQGTKLIERKPGFAAVRFKAILRGWTVLSYVMLFATFLIGVPLAWTLGVAMRSSPFAPFNVGAALITMLIFIGGTVFSFFKTHPWVKLVATPDYIQVGGKFYDRQHYGGIRLGYEINLKGGGALSNSFEDVFGNRVGLRLGYGLWGEDLPYMVDKYHSNEIVLWLNMIISATQQPPVGPSMEHGARTQRFES